MRPSGTKNPQHCFPHFLTGFPTSPHSFSTSNCENRKKSPIFPHSVSVKTGETPPCGSLLDPPPHSNLSQSPGFDHKI